MPDQGKLCVCPQCGKKYMLKEGFEAKSFSCKACGATVWVTGKPPAPVPTSSKGSAPSPRAATKGGRGGRASAASHGAARRSRHGGRHEREEEEAEGGRHGRGHGREKPKSNTLYFAIGGVALVGIIVAVVLMTSKKPPKAPPQDVAQQPPAATGTETPAPGSTGTETPSPAKPAVNPAPANPEAAKPGEKAPAEGAKETPGEDEGAQPEETPKPKLGGDGTKEKPKSKWDPPATLTHLDSTPAEQRKQIDELIAVMMDPKAGIDSVRAKDKLAAMGKPAFPPILGAMAKIRDSIGDTDSQDEKDWESSLKLGDECLRQMDGYLEAHDKAVIRPGTDKEYINYILRIHYQRWERGIGGQKPLKDMDTMPGPFDASSTYKDEGPDSEEGGK